MTTSCFSCASPHSTATVCKPPPVTMRADSGRGGWQQGGYMCHKGAQTLLRCMCFHARPALWQAAGLQGPHEISAPECTAYGSTHLGCLACKVRGGRIVGAKHAFCERRQLGVQERLDVLEDAGHHLELEHVHACIVAGRSV